MSNPQDDPASGAPRPPVDAAPPSPPPPPPGYVPMAYGPPPKRGGAIAKVLTSLLLSLFLISVLANIYLGVIVTSLTAGPSEVSFMEGDTKERVVILPVIGTIDSDMSNYVRSALQELAKDPPAALILRVDSGGGGVGASDQIWHYISQYKSATGKPIIASFGTVAASGGYYISAPSDWIICEEAGLTGSIGVMAQVPTIEGLMQKIGVDMHTIVAEGSGEKDIANNVFRAWTAEDQAKVQNLVDVFYERFVQIVAQGRAGLTEEQVKQVATGGVLTAEEAKAAKLVDQVGYLSDAIDKAAQMGNLTGKPRVTIIRRPGGLGLLGLLGANSGGLELEGLSAERLRSLASELSQVSFDYRMNLR